MTLCLVKQSSFVFRLCLMISDIVTIFSLVLKAQNAFRLCRVSTPS